MIVAEVVLRKIVVRGNLLPSPSLMVTSRESLAFFDDDQIFVAVERNALRHERKLPRVICVVPVEYGFHRVTIFSDDGVSCSLVRRQRGIVCDGRFLLVPA